VAKASLEVASTSALEASASKDLRGEGAQDSVSHTEAQLPTERAKSPLASTTKSAKQHQSAIAKRRRRKQHGVRIVIAPGQAPVVHGKLRGGPRMAAMVNEALLSWHDRVGKEHVAKLRSDSVRSQLGATNRRADVGDSRAARVPPQLEHVLYDSKVQRIEVKGPPSMTREPSLVISMDELRQSFRKENNIRQSMASTAGRSSMGSVGAEPGGSSELLGSIAPRGKRDVPLHLKDLEGDAHPNLRPSVSSRALTGLEEMRMAGDAAVQAIASMKQVHKPFGW